MTTTFHPTDISTNDIAYLLGYAELNSFLRAFTIWTGESISKYKKHRGKNSDE
jgi:AraC-like DNA-binding protein